MLAILCALPFLPSAMSGRPSIFGQEEYLRYVKIVPQMIDHVPPNDVEVRYGWRRIDMGEDVFREISRLKVSITFQAPSDTFSTLMQISKGQRYRFHWVRVNIPGANVKRDEDLISRYRHTDTEVGHRVILVFPQKKKVNTANQTFTALRKHDIASLVAALELNPADAITAYTIYGVSCEGDENRFSNEDTPDCENLKPNMEQITNPEVFVTPPRGVVEVEYVDGTSLRMGTCLPLFLIISAPASVKFTTTPDTFYTLCFVQTFVSLFSKWLLVNIPGDDISKAVEVVPYSLNLDLSHGESIIVLFSQGKNEIDVSDIMKLSSFTPKAISETFKLGEPVPANFLRQYYTAGVLPRKHPSHPPLTDVVTSVLPATTGSASMLLNGRVYVAVKGFVIMSEVAMFVA